ncbi:hypothetical protein B0H16DRAFT_1550621, partial [Mycena metata]
EFKWCALSHSTTYYLLLLTLFHLPPPPASTSGGAPPFQHHRQPVCPCGCILTRCTSAARAIFSRARQVSAPSW